jgi:hypothetical protein
MKRLAFCLSLLFFLVSPSYAAVYSATGTIYILEVFDSTHGSDVDWFSLVGVSSLGACRTADAGYVVMLLRDDLKGQRMFTLALAAKTSGTPVTVQVDDAVTDSAGFCYVQYIR